MPGELPVCLPYRLQHSRGQAFGEEVAKAYNITMEGECLFGHDGVMWLVDAINRAGSADPQAIRDALEQTDVFEGLIGTLVMDPATHNPSMACAVYECHGDSFDFKEIIEAQCPPQGKEILLPPAFF